MALFKPSQLVLKSTKTNEQVQEMYNYLFTLVEQLNFAIATLESNSTTNVANSLNSGLNGQIEASVASVIRNGISPQTIDNIVTFATSCKDGITPFKTGTSTTNIPANFSNHSYGFVCKTSGTARVYITNTLGDGKIATAKVVSGAIDSWKYLTPN